jgi:metacaspase-1
VFPAEGVRVGRRALCVGINEYPLAGASLQGCVNDARAWAELLTTHYGFAPSDVALLLDAQATKANIMAGLRDLLTGARAGDVLVFANASHGTYIPDASGDETYDQAMCPYDCADNLIVDDELRALFAKALPRGARLTIISDSCFSGTVTRVDLSELMPGIAVPDERRVRFLSPALRGVRVLPNPWQAKPKDKVPQSRMKEVLLSGCSAKEYSYDALIEGTYHGAMTYFALQTIAEAGYELTYEELAARLSPLLEEADYNQHPQLEGRATNKRRPLFS